MWVSLLFVCLFFFCRLLFLAGLVVYRRCERVIESEVSVIECEVICFYFPRLVAALFLIFAHALAPIEREGGSP
jgi:hypothetical protein